MRLIRLSIVPLLILLLAAGLAACRQEPKLTPEELAAQYRAQAESYLAESYPGLSTTVKGVTVTGQSALVEASTLLLGEKCAFQVRVGKTRPASDNLSATSREVFARRVWNELYERYETGTPRITSCTVRGNDELEFAMESQFSQVDAVVPFTLTLTLEGSRDDLLQQVKMKAAELAGLYLERTYPTTYKAQVAGKVSQSGEPATVPATIECLGETVGFQVKVCPDVVGDDLFHRLNQMKWFSRATVWTYSQAQDCPGDAPVHAGTPLSFYGLEGDRAYVHAAGPGDGGSLPLWYLTRNPSEIIPSLAPVLHVMKEGATVHSVPAEGAQTISSPIAGQLVQVTAEYGEYSYGRLQTYVDRSPVAGWIPTKELAAFSVDAHPVLVKTVLEQLDHLAPEYLKRYSLFQPLLLGNAALEGMVARINCLIKVFNQEILFHITYDGVYSDDLSSKLSGLTVYPRLPLIPLANGDEEFAPGQPLQVLDLDSGAQVGAWAGNELPWALVSNGKLRGWLPVAYLSTDATDRYEAVEPYELIVARETTARFFPGEGDTIEILTQGKVVQVIAQSAEHAYVRYVVEDVLPWGGGWVRLSDLRAFDAALSKEGILARGAVVRELGPDNPSRLWENTWDRPVSLGDEKDGWIYVLAPGGIYGWTDVKNVISRNPWRIP